MSILKKIYFLIDISFKNLLILFLMLFGNFGIIYYTGYANLNEKNHLDEYIKNTFIEDQILSKQKLLHESTQKSGKKEYSTLSNKSNNKEENSLEIKHLIIGSVIEIPKIGILQPMYVMNIGDFRKRDEKISRNSIEFELNSLYNINNGFFIGGHSSGYFWDSDSNKEIFKDLHLLNIGDEIKITTHFSNNTTKTFIYTVGSKEIGKNLKVNKSDKLLFTCYPNNTSAERLVLFLKEKK